MTDNILIKYYQGIMDQIQAEVDQINDSFHHNGLKGEGNENKIRDLIRKFIPKKYGVGTGIVIDKDGNQSKQCDIIIYDNYNYPEFLSLSSVKMFPVDIVYAVIEVKTTLDKTQSIGAINNIKSVRNLNYIKDRFRVYPNDPVEEINHETTMFEVTCTSPPIGLVFGYSSSTNSNATFGNWFKTDNKEESHLLPSHICCLDQGILAINNSCNSKSRYLSHFLYPYNQKDDLICFIKKSHIIEINGKKWCKINNGRYPFIVVGKERMVTDQSKILLNFILYLTEFLQQKRISPHINFRESYLPQELRNILINHNNKIMWRKEDYPHYSENINK